jgi:hypothetical protein
MPDAALSEQLLRERDLIVERIHAQREQLERLRIITERMEDRLSYDEHLLGELEGILGVAAQLRLEALDERLRGKRLEEVAIAVLREECGPEAVVHYRDWFKMVRARGHHVGGKEPLGTFLAQINRSSTVERVGRRTGRYRLAPALVA